MLNKDEERKISENFDLESFRIKFLKDIIELQTSFNFAIFVDKERNIFRLGNYCVLPKKLLLPFPQNKKVSKIVIVDKIVFFHFSSEETFRSLLSQEDIEKRIKFNN